MLISELYSIYLKYPKVVIDSRQAVTGSIFFALQGEHSDGNAFAANALGKGCAYAIIDKQQYAVSDRCIVVDDVLKTLQALALHHRKQVDVQFIAITGTNGKTTTKELIKEVLSATYKVHATSGNLNNHIGVPLTLLSMPADTEIAVVEMGANHPGEIAFLCEIALPTHGLITNVGMAHLEGFGSFEGVVQTKTELYRFIDKGNGTLFINSEQKELVKHAALTGCKKLYYGNDENDFCTGRFLGLNPFLSFTLCEAGKKKTEACMDIHTRLVGKYNIQNALAAACIGMDFGIGMEQIKQCIEQYEPENQRSQLMKTGSNTLILDNYNANPSSMKAALENFREFPHPNKFLILGDMLELGERAFAEHRRVLETISDMGLTQVYLVGPIFGQAMQSEHFQWFKNSDSLAEYFSKHTIRDAAILIKGSRGIKLEKIIEYL